MGRDWEREGLMPPEGAAALREILDLIRCRRGESEKSFRKRRAKTVGALRAAREGGQEMPVIGQRSLNRELIDICYPRHGESAADQKRRAAKTWAALKGRRKQGL